MTKNNDFEPLHINDIEYSIEHLKSIDINLCVEFSNGDTRDIAIHMRPTNHLFSRKVSSSDYQNRTDLEQSGHWLKSYIHHEGNYHQVIGNPLKIKEYRIFCKQKWGYSFLFPEFVKLIKTNPSHVTILANPGDQKTCLSGILEIENHPNLAYLVFFSLTKVNAKEANMLIESAYCVDSTIDKKAQKLLEQTRGDTKPFIVALKNIMEGRKAFESLKRSSRNYKNKKKKKAKL